MSETPTTPQSFPYSPPDELKRTATAELAGATTEELRGAARAYAAYRSATGERCPETGRALPKWDGDLSASEHAAWLAAYRATWSPLAKQLDTALEDYEGCLGRGFARLTEDWRLSLLLPEMTMATVRRLAEVGLPEAMHLLFSKLFEAVQAHVEQDRELRLSVGALFSALWEQGRLDTHVAEAIERSASACAARGDATNAAFLRGCARGQVVMPATDGPRAGGPGAGVWLGAASEPSSAGKVAAPAGSSPPPPSAQQPSIGGIVHIFTEAGRAPLPAIITRVRPGGPAGLTLTVTAFSPTEAPRVLDAAPKAAEGERARYPCWDWPART